jgi:hypothetical protein
MPQKAIQNSKLVTKICVTLIVVLLLITFLTWSLFDLMVIDKGLAIKLVTSYLLHTRPGTMQIIDDSNINMADFIMIYPISDDGIWIKGADGHPLILFSNINSKDPSWEQLVWFLKDDKTDKKIYSKENFFCTDYAEMLYNNAEKAGWNAAFIAISTCNITDREETGHALNAFNTTDHGIVYIDCTRDPTDTANQIIDSDKLVKMEIGKPIEAIYIFPQKHWPLFHKISPRLELLHFDLVEW